MQRQTYLAQIIGAVRSVRGCPNALHRGKQDGNQNANNGDYNQQFQQGKAPTNMEDKHEQSP
jgi:hypothetical protein